MKIIDSNIDTTNYDHATKKILSWAELLETKYICLATVQTIMEAHDSLEFRRILNTADMVTPDGMPLVWMLKVKGYQDQTRVYGPTLMLHLLQAAMEKKIPIGLYGGSNKTLTALNKNLLVRFPTLSIVYAYSPPFRKLSGEEDDQICMEIIKSGPQILFVSLGCPKQERWMAEHRGRLNLVMVGVGAAFDFHAGVKSQAPPWMQNSGLEWFFRLLTEPKRLWKRYLVHNPRFIFLAIADLLGLIH